jgi:two-component system, NtrC family, response regulator AtoC
MVVAHTRVLVAHQEPAIRRAVVEGLRGAGHEVGEAGTGEQALDLVHDGVDLVVVDDTLPDAQGLSVLREVKAYDPDVLLIMLASGSDVATAVEAMKVGAYHVATSPLDLADLLRHVQRALETTYLRREVRLLRARQSNPHGFDAIVGASPQMAALRVLLRKVASSPASTVLLTGESGTGKDLAAKVLHYNSNRAARLFMNITCSALPDSLLESELFGHERGAFTDARAMKRGLLELAHGGTVFLDEIGEMVPPLQAKLLRFLEEKVMRRVGGTQDIPVDVRVIAATNRDLEAEVQAGRFRSDLYYRLSVLPICLPPLRTHADDVPALIEFYIAGFNREFRRRVRGATPAAVRLLQGYGWPGNVRELRNAVERAMLLSDAEWLEPEDFPVMAAGPTPVDGPDLPAHGVDLEQLERKLLSQALERCGGNQTRAGELLGLNRDQVRYRIEKFGLTRAMS